jgi:hypothetical protein
MSPKITADHLARAAIVYVRQSTMAQVVGNLESQRRQYDLAGAARATGFASVKVIDDDLGRSGSGTVQRPGCRSARGPDADRHDKLLIVFIREGSLGCAASHPSHASRRGDGRVARSRRGRLKLDLTQSLRVLGSTT